MYDAECTIAASGFFVVFSPSSANPRVGVFVSRPTGTDRRSKPSVTVAPRPGVRDDVVASAARALSRPVSVLQVRSG